MKKVRGKEAAMKGSVLGGKLALENGHGDRIGSASFDPAPLATLILTRTF